MPKGIRKSNDNNRARAKPSAEALGDLPVSVGATRYPLVEGYSPEDIPPGVAVRSRRGVQIEYSLRGRKTLTLPGDPTVRAVRAAAAFRTRLIDTIEDGGSEELVAQMISEVVQRATSADPASTNGSALVSVLLPDRASVEALTIGVIVDEYLFVKWSGLAPNSRKDYVGYVRGRIKPMGLSGLGLADECFIEGQHSGSQPIAVGFSIEHSKEHAAAAWWPTSTLPCVRELIEVPLGSGELPSGRRKRRMAAWKRAGSGDGAASPLMTKSVHVIRPYSLPLQCLGQLRASALTDVVAAAIVSTWSQSLAPKTIINILSFLKAAVQRLVVAGKLHSNPFAEVKVSKKELPNRQPGVDAGGDADSEVDYSTMDAVQARAVAGYERDDDDPDPFSDVEMLAVLSKLDPHMRAHFTFAFMTGVRTGELIALQRRDYDPNNCRVRVRRSLSRSFEGKPKSRLARWVQLNPLAKAALESQLTQCQGPADYVFINPVTRQQWSGSSKVVKRWRRALLAAGVRYRIPYQTRHTYATLMLLAGESPYFVATQLGHTDLDMIEKRYARFIVAARSRQPGAAMAVVHASMLEELSMLLRQSGPTAPGGAAGEPPATDLGKVA